MNIMHRFLFGLSLAASSVALQAAPVNINQASAEDIAKALTGIGLTKANAIVAYRHAHGAFTSPDGLTMVKGVGKKTVELNRTDIRLADMQGK